MPHILDRQCVEKPWGRSDVTLPLPFRVAGVLHGLAGIDRNAAKIAGKPRNKVQHGKSSSSRTTFEKIPNFQRVCW